MRFINLNLLLTFNFGTLSHQANFKKNELMFFGHLAEISHVYRHQSSGKLLFSGKFENMSSIRFNGRAAIFLIVSFLYRE